MGKEKPKVLVISKDLGYQGGVVNYVDMLFRHSAGAVSYEHLRVGQKLGDAGRIGRLMCPFTDNFRLARKLLRDDIDVVHLNPSLNVKALLRDGVFLLTLFLFQHRKTVVFMHGWDTKIEARISGGGLPGAIFRLIYSRASVTNVLGTRFRDSLVQMGLRPDSVRVTSTMFDGSIFQGLTPGTNGTRVSILFMSRFVREKGCYELLEAFQKVSQAHPEARLVMAGDGPEKTRMEDWVRANNISDRVSFPGYLRNSDKAQALLDADIFLFPTYYGEGCPVVLLEAMAAGLPIITALAGGIPDVFDGSEGGVLLDAVTPDTIGSALEDMLVDEAHRHAAGEYNRIKAWRDYEADIVTLQMETLYQEVCSDG